MKTALIVVDVQQSFRQRAYWRDEDVPAFIVNLQKLIDRCEARGIPVVQVFHQEEDEGPQGAFSRHSGHVKAMPELRIRPDAVFFKSVHSALFGRDSAGTSLEQWLRARGMSYS